MLRRLLALLAPPGEIRSRSACSRSRRFALSHSTSGFLGFREGGRDAALVIVVAEIAAVILATPGAVARLVRPRRAP